MLILCGAILVLFWSASSTAQSPDDITSKWVTSRVPNTNECGWDNIVDSIENSPNYAKFGEFPWMVAVLKYRQVSPDIWSFDDFIAGGSIIHESVVMTVAHKVIGEKAERLKCRAGEWDTQNVDKTKPVQERMVKTMVTHPKFFKTSVYNDVALLFLQERFNLASAPHIGIACLMKQMPAPSTNCFTMGWGKLNVKESNSPKLKKLNMSLVSAEDCQSNLQRSRLGRFFVLHESLTCAVGVKDTCHNDGGSSLVCSIANFDLHTRYAVVGMVAYGIGCDVKDRPGVYVNIPNVHSWISETMNDHKYGTTTFEYSVTSDD